MLYNIHLFDSNKVKTIESTNYEISDGFVHFYYDCPGLDKIKVASYKECMISCIEMTNTSLLKTDERLKKLKSLDISKWQKFKNMFI